MPRFAPALASIAGLFVNIAFESARRDRGLMMEKQASLAAFVDSLA